MIKLVEPLHGLIYPDLIFKQWFNLCLKFQLKKTQILSHIRGFVSKGDMEIKSSLMCFVIDKISMLIKDKLFQEPTTFYQIHYITMHVSA